MLFLTPLRKDNCHSMSSLSRRLTIRTRRLPFGLCGLSEDETAIATLMWQTGEYVAGVGENPYGFEEAFLDVKMGNLE